MVTKGEALYLTVSVTFIIFSGFGLYYIRRTSQDVRAIRDRWVPPTEGAAILLKAPEK